MKSTIKDAEKYVDKVGKSEHGLLIKENLDTDEMLSKNKDISKKKDGG